MAFLGYAPSLTLFSTKALGREHFLRFLEASKFIVENVLFKISCDIFDHHCPVLRFMMSFQSIRDSDHFVSGLLCRSSNSCCNSTDSSLVQADYLLN